jgi:EmrB/QacA subfamily drug resistance transporter
MFVALVVACAFFMETFTGTVITTALPAMARSLGSDPVQLSLGVTAYMLSLSVFIPASGWVADRYGARTIFRAAICLFTIASVLCGLSNNLAELVAARIIQGVGGAMMVPVGRLVLLRSVDRADFVRAMAYVTVPAFIGPVLGPPIGGFITTYFSWRWIFFLNIPIGVLGMILVTLRIENYKEEHSPPLDWLGFALTGLSLSCLIYSLDLAARAAFGAVLVIVVAVAVSLGWAAALHARRHTHPMINLTLLRIPTFAISFWGGLFFRTAAGALPYLLPVFLQVGFGLSAFASGLITFGDALGAISMNALAPMVLRRLGFRRVLVGNAVASALSIVACGLLTASVVPVAMLGVLFLSGFLKSLQYNALSTLAYAEVASPQMSAATSFASMAQQVSNGAGVAIGAVLIEASLLARGAPSWAATAGDIRYAFFVIAALALCSVVQFRRLAGDAGAELSGHRVPLTQANPSGLDD